MSKKLTNNEFIEKAKFVHDDKYDYSKCEYLKNTLKVKIICKEHGEFSQSPASHMKGSGCNKCVTRRPKKGLTEFIEQAISLHVNKYDYSLVKYNGTHNDIIIVCKEHGEFSQSPSNHLSGKGCYHCYKKNSDLTKLDMNILINDFNLIHNYKYDYSLVSYKNIRSKIKIICKKHGNFFQNPKNHRSGQGCPKCSRLIGIKETKWLDSLNVPVRQFRIGRYVVDGYDPDTNTVYEFNGDYWHGNPSKYNSTDINQVAKKTFGELYENTLKKETKLKSLGYNVVSIWESDCISLNNSILMV